MLAFPTVQDLDFEHRQVAATCNLWYAYIPINVHSNLVADQEL